jgi:hypothetical protein
MVPSQQNFADILVVEANEIGITVGKCNKIHCSNTAK